MATNFGLTIIFQYYLHVSYGPLLQQTQLVSSGSTNTSDKSGQQSRRQRQNFSGIRQKPDSSFKNTAIRIPTSSVWVCAGRIDLRSERLSLLRNTMESRQSLTSTMANRTDIDVELHLVRLREHGASPRTRSAGSPLTPAPRMIV